MWHLSQSMLQNKQQCSFMVDQMQSSHGQQLPLTVHAPFQKTVSRRAASLLPMHIISITKFSLTFSYQRQLNCRHYTELQPFYLISQEQVTYTKASYSFPATKMDVNYTAEETGWKYTVMYIDSCRTAILTSWIWVSPIRRNAELQHLPF